MRRWYLVQAKAASESVAETNLERQGYEVYYPRAIRQRRRRGAQHEGIVALFPRYLFLRLDEGRQALAPVRSTLGVVCVVRFGFSYAVVPDFVIDELRSRADPDTGLHRVGRAAVLERGMSVQVTAGPFDGFEGVFEREVGAERVVILLNLLGQTARVQVALDAITPAGAAA